MSFTVAINDFKPDNPNPGDLAKWKGGAYLWVDGWRQLEGLVPLVISEGAAFAFFDQLRQTPVCDLS